MKLLGMMVGALLVAGCAASAEDSTASLTAAVSTASQSDSTTSAPSQGKGHRGPPPEAYTACEGKSAGDACSVTHGDHTLAGTCAAPPADAQDTRLACRPDHMPEGGPPPGGGPPRHGGGHGDCDKAEGNSADTSPDPT